MKYIPPLNYLPGDENNEDRSHWNANPAGDSQALQDGAAPSAIGFEAVQREVVNAITAAGLVPDNADYTQLGAALLSLSGVPTGATMFWTASTPPSKWLECDGSLLSRDTYSALFAVIGTTYGVGDGATTFALPDSRGEFFRGWDNGRGIDTGRVLGTVQADEIKSHNHDYRFGDGGTNTTALPYYYTNNNFTSDNYNVTSSEAVRPTGGDETRPRNVTRMEIIKY